MQSGSPQADSTQANTSQEKSSQENSSQENYSLEKSIQKNTTQKKEVDSSTKTAGNIVRDQVSVKEPVSQNTIKENSTSGTGFSTDNDSTQRSDKPAISVDKVATAQHLPENAEVKQADSSPSSRTPISDTSTKKIIVAPHPDRILQQNKSAGSSVKVEENNQKNIKVD